VSGEPKNYAYRTIDTVNGRKNTVCKINGITLNYKTKQLVNFEAINDMILGTEEPMVTVHTERKMKRKRKGGGIVSTLIEPEDELYRISFFKRRLLDDISPVRLQLGRVTGKRALLQTDHVWVMILNLGIRFRAL